MNAKIRYTNEPVDAKIIKDFLPRPEELAFREEGVKVTIALSKKSVEFFKSEAAKLPYSVSAYDPQAYRHLCGSLRQTIGNQKTTKIEPLRGKAYQNFQQPFQPVPGRLRFVFLSVSAPVWLTSTLGIEKKYENSKNGHYRLFFT